MSKEKVEKLYYLFCSEEEEFKLRDHGLEYLEEHECEILPYVLEISLNNRDQITKAIYAASIHSGYFMISEKEYNKYKFWFL
jgi:hypothetical protein